MISDFIDSALVVDDQKNEAQPLIDCLKSKGIAVDYYKFDHANPPKADSNEVVYKNRKAIFLDLYLNESDNNIMNHIANIRNFLRCKVGKNFGAYGIVLWTKHSSELSELIGKLETDKVNGDLYSMPLFIAALDKMKYADGNYGTLFSDLDAVVQNSPAATFFLDWANALSNAEERTISKLYRLIPYDKESDFLCLFGKIARNHTGIASLSAGYPLHIDAHKAFDEILQSELYSSHKNATNVFQGRTIPAKFSENIQSAEIIAKTNAAFFVDDTNVDQSIVVPGNVYEVVATDRLKRKGISDTDKIIVMEISPPCDAASPNKRIRARLIGGFTTTSPFNETSQFYYKDLPSVYINCEIVKVVLDFRHLDVDDDANLKNKDMYKLLFRATPKLFADVLQKFSSHAARLGISSIHEDTK